MESARKYTTASYSFRRLEETDFSNIFSGRSFGDEGSLSNGELKKEPEKERMSKTGKMITKEEIIELRNRMESVRNNYAARSEEETKQESIRQSSIMYILELLFKDARERFHDWIEKTTNGYSVKGSSGNGSYFNEYGSGEKNYDAASLLTMDAAQMMNTPVKKISLMAVDRYEEYEETSFSAKGIVRTGDGRELGFNIDVSMSRSFVRETGISLGIEAMKTCDPLVINLDGSVATVSDQKIRFDIDGDGELDTVSRLSKGNGYLALDKNGDGIINDGNELFGAKSGDGFADLAMYDEDGDGWIDEDDEIWNRLKICVTEENGKSHLYSFAEAGIGAICLQKMSTEFADTDENNSPKAFIRSTGVFLYENGMAGTIQHLDLVKYAQEA